MQFPDFDDKDLIIFAVTIICMTAMFQLTDSQTIVSNGISGLLGMAIGTKLIKP